MLCPLCDSPDSADYFQDARRFLQCAVCRLVFVDEADWISRESERTHYDLHENSPEDQRYRQFLGRLCDPLAAKLSPASSGLDFGCGPGPTLSVMLQEQGHRIELYDSFYFPDSVVFETTYDFITASEVVEHLHRPRWELQRLWDCVMPAGQLGIMTKRVLNQERFATWHYKNDPTHVCFFSEAAFEWLASEWQAVIEFRGADVVIFTKCR